MSRRTENTRVVKFKTDFKKGKKVLYKKDQTYYIHKDVVAKLKLSSAVAEVDEFNEKEEIRKAKIALKKR